MSSEAKRRNGPFGATDDLFEHPWQWEPVSRERAVALCVWEPICVLRSGPGYAARPELFCEQHFLYRAPLAGSEQYFRRRQPWQLGSGVQAAATDVRTQPAPADVAPDTIAETAKQLSARPRDRRLRARLLDDATGAPLPGISLNVARPDGQTMRVPTDAAGRIDVDAGGAVSMSLSVDNPHESGGAG